MIDVTPILAFLALVAGPVLIARLLTGGEPIDLPGLIATVIGPPPQR